MSTRWVCDYCGYQGRSDDDRPVDQVQCPMCGEPVTPLP
jgi:rubrerythrin